MTLIDCSRCKGMRFNDKTGRFDLGTAKPTMRVENVMATTERIHYVCGNCGFKETRPYGWEEKSKPGETQQKLTE